MTFKVPPILLAVVFAVSAFSVTLVVPTAEADTDGCLRIEMGGKDYGVFHNRCDVGLLSSGMTRERAAPAIAWTGIRVRTGCHRSVQQEQDRSSQAA